MARDFGVVVAPENKPIRRSQEMRLDSDVDQFKYYQTVQIKRTMPAGANTLTLSYQHGLAYLPAFETFFKGYRGTWGKVIRGAQAAGYASHAEWPYFGVESIDGVNYNLSLTSTDATLPLHEITLRLTLLYNEAFV